MKQITQWIRFPELEIVYEHTLLHCDDPPFLELETHKPLSASFFFRPAVVNIGSGRAEKVEVIALDLHTILPAGKRAFQRRYSMNLGWSNAGTMVLEGLSPGIDRFFDLGKILHPVDRRTIRGEHLPNNPGLLFSIEMQVKGTHLVHLLPVGRHELGIVVVAANCKPVRYVATIDLKTQWEEDIEGILERAVKIDIKKVEL